MNLRHLQNNEPLRDMLAAQYVLGTLRGGARRRFERWLEDDATLRQAVAQWQGRLHPMAEFAPAAQPSPAVWTAIEKQLDLRSAPINQSRKSFWLGLREDLGFWRGLGMASTALATILATVLLIRAPELAAPAANYVATLADEKAQTVMVITGDARRRQLTVKVVTQQQVAADRSLELWALPKEGAPRSLGLVAANGTVTLPLPENATPESTPVLAISLEPKGGSPNPNAPSGPVIYKGTWVRI
ncbi:anti-sigma factor [Noviherbaspirillum sp. CPCC 100848]|uniref:Regulator of SigK n=1 Tax=Noviherbaspirillum album TaxID=3080276 RepID=A0ABU6J6W2_9BURK|nr:anti-sigma factor [Noviherbaspirillum sp. CPCC 100848]MEC4719151.1 anti-sigma factor [Noviherbaspirillum sp. CPCC 100848]